MNLEKSSLIKILKENNYFPSQVSKLNKGGANISYKFYSNNKYYIAKCYQREYYFSLCDQLKKIIEKYNIKFVLKNTKIIEKKFRIEITNFNYGNHVYKYTNNQIESLLQIINMYTKYEIEVSKKEYRTIYSKVNNYYKYFKDNLTTLNKVSKDIIQTLNYVYDNLILKDDMNMCIVHGDLSPENILWNNDVPTILDFDECIYSHKEYEIASFILKSSFNKGKLDIEMAKKIKECAFKNINDLNELYLKNYLLFYILKVLYEKLYFYEITDLDIESDKQKKDYWLWWYNLIINNDMDGLF